MEKYRYIGKELQHHLPFSIFSVAAGLIIVGILTFITELAGIGNPSANFEELFHIFHPLHILFSAVATTAMFWQNERNFIKALFIGIIGSLGICGISDIFIPYIAGILLGAKMELHICVIQHSQIVLPFLALGLVAGFLAPGNIEKAHGVVFSHSSHVFVSAAASIMYLVSFGMVHWIHQIGGILVFMVLAVVIPCCTSDIVFPLLCIKNPEHTHQH